MELNKMYNMAFDIASRAHAGQYDKSGRVYVLHPIRVSERCVTLKAKIVALLHDTIEDTDVTVDYLRETGFPDEIVEAVLSVTRREGETYEDYVRRAAMNPIGREVKIADLEDNMNVFRLPEFTDRDAARIRKYIQAWHYLQNSGAAR